jgi:uncharacterized protein YjbJ (UPF0337 family)
MGGELDETKGRIKQAAGDLADDEDLKREGKIDEVSGALKDKLDDAKDWVKDKFRHRDRD